MVDQPVNGLYEVLVMKPRDVLAAVAVGTAKPATDQPKEDIEDSAGVRAHGHGGAKQYFPRLWDDGVVGGLFPCVGHLDTEPPGVRDAGLCTAQDA